jgi:hypothetical protein
VTDDFDGQAVNSQLLGTLGAWILVGIVVRLRTLLYDMHDGVFALVCTSAQEESR